MVLYMLPCKILSLQLQKCPKYANFCIIQLGMVKFGYILVWFGMVLYNLVRDHCPDMLPCKIWSLQLQKYQSYPNFRIIWFLYGLVWVCYILVWFGMVTHQMVFDYWPDMLPCKIWSLQLQNCPSYANFSLFWFVMVWFGYILVWFDMVLNYLVCDHCPDMLPYKIWSLQLQKYPIYVNFSIILFGMVWFGYILV